MAKTKQQKKELVDRYSEILKNSKGVVVLEPKAVTPNEANAFRKEIFEFGAGYHVVKNTLFKIALENNKMEKLEELESGEHAVLYLGEDIVNPAKKLKEFIKELTDQESKEVRMQIVSGFLDGSKLTKEQVMELSEMPDKEGSIAMILGVLDQAIGGAVNVLQNPVQSYVNIVDQAFEGKEE